MLEIFFKSLIGNQILVSVLVAQTDHKRTWYKTTSNTARFDTCHFY